MGAPLRKTLSLYSSGCWSKTRQHGSEMTRVLMPCALSLLAASNAMLTSLPELTIVRSSFNSSCKTYPPRDAVSMLEPSRFGRF